MEFSLYVALFVLLLLLAGGFAIAEERASKSCQAQDSKFLAFKFWFLLGWGPCIAADWLQGPYLYTLCSAYGFQRDTISQLFLAGFVVSGVAGSFVGRLADRFGRRRACEVYCLLYIFACAAFHFNRFEILMIGRVAGGFATSLLYSVFESWVASEMLSTHRVDIDTLRHVFGRMYFTSYAAAIMMGLVSQALVANSTLQEIPYANGLYWGGPTLPYDASILSLLLGLLIMRFKWNENFGERDTSKGEAVPIHWAVWVAGLVCACFESAMYIFVFNFTPALPGQPMGVVFSLFMLAAMSGASMVSLSGKLHIRTANYLPVMLLVASVALSIPVLIGFSCLETMTSFIVYEAVVGFYWPAMGAVKGRLVPDESRANVYNLFRIPLNIIVVSVLLSNPSLKASFVIVASLLGIASCLSIPVAVNLRQREQASESSRELSSSLLQSTEQ